MSPAASLRCPSSASSSLRRFRTSHLVSSPQCRLQVRSLSSKSAAGGRHQPQKAELRASHLRRRSISGIWRPPPTSTPTLPASSSLTSSDSLPSRRVSSSCRLHSSRQTSHSLEETSSETLDLEKDSDPDNMSAGSSMLFASAPSLVFPVELCILSHWSRQQLKRFLISPTLRLRFHLRFPTQLELSNVL